MKTKLLIPMNIQFFAEENKDGAGNPDNTGSGDNTDTTINNNGGNEPPQEIDPSAFADIISEKDKQIQQLQNDVNELKKTNAMLTVRVNAGSKPVEFNTEKAILDFCDTRKVK